VSNGPTIPRQGTYGLRVWQEAAPQPVCIAKFVNGLMGVRVSTLKRDGCLSDTTHFQMQWIMG
jgi:hypothetical protein